MLSAALLLLSPGRANACETCGCSAAGGDPGLLPGWGGNYLALSFRMDHFDNGWQAPLDGSEALFRSRDHLYNWTLAGAWQPADRVHLLAGLPYRWNHRMQGSTALDRRGFGDAWVLARYALWMQEQPEGSLPGQTGAAQRSFISIGGGLELPSGAFAPESAEALLPVNNQLGSGSWDLQAELRSRFAFGERHSLNLDAMARRNGTNPEGYRFGHAATMQLHWRWASGLPGMNGSAAEAAAGGASASPKAPWHWALGLGLAGDWMGLDANNGFLRTDTGGKALLGQASVQAGKGPASFVLRYRQPFWQDYAGGQTRLRSSMDLALSWQFAGS